LHIIIHDELLKDLTMATLGVVHERQPPRIAISHDSWDIFANLTLTDLLAMFYILLMGAL